MERSGINLPTAMTPEARQTIQGVCLDFRLFAYGLTDWETVGWYKEKYPWFIDEQYAIFEMYSDGFTANQHRNILKKTADKAKK